MESHKLNIGGEEFIFKAENADLLYESAILLHEQIEELKEHYGHNADYKKLSVLAALNIISKQEDEKRQSNLLLEQLTVQVKELTEHLTFTV